METPENDGSDWEVEDSLINPMSDNTDMDVQPGPGQEQIDFVVDRLSSPATKQFRTVSLHTKTLRLAAGEAAKPTGKEGNTSQDSLAVVAEPGENAISVVLADGAGGHEGGQEASQGIVNGLQPIIARNFGTVPNLNVSGVDARRQAWQDKINPIHQSIERGATTLSVVNVVAAPNGKKTAEWLTIGDSPIMLWRDGQLTQLGVEETGPQWKIDESRSRGIEPTAEQIREWENTPKVGNAITNGLGAQYDGDARIDSRNYGITELKEGDVLLVCSDGLTGDRESQRPVAEIDGVQMTGNQLVGYILGRQDLRPEEKVQRLKAYAKKVDDFTAVVIEVGSSNERGKSTAQEVPIINTGNTVESKVTEQIGHVIEDFKALNVSKKREIAQKIANERRYKTLLPLDRMNPQEQAVAFDVDDYLKPVGIVAGGANVLLEIGRTGNRDDVEVRIYDQQLVQHVMDSLVIGTRDAILLLEGSGHFESRELSNGRQISFGRSLEKSDVAIGDSSDLELSRQHFRIMRSGDKVIIEDTSTNGMQIDPYSLDMQKVQIVQSN